MISFEDVRALVDRLVDAGPCLQEFRAAVVARPLRQSGPGRLSAAEAGQIYEERQRNADAAGIDTCGVSETLRRLRECPPDDGVFLFHFADASALFTLFVSEGAGDLLGCMRVTGQ